MAKNREAALKRAREKARQDKRDAKQERAEARKADVSEIDPAKEQALMEQFARLSERHASNEIPTATYEEERHRIFVELGIESDD